jgi:hypothetical protein
MPYRYDDMGDERFQQMCQALPIEPSVVLVLADRPGIGAQVSAIFRCLPRRSMPRSFLGRASTRCILSRT